MSGLLQSDLTSGISGKQQRNENNDCSDMGAMRRLLKVCQTITRMSEYFKAAWQRRHTKSKSTEFIICRSWWPRGLRRVTAENRGSNPAGEMDVCLLWVLCVGISPCEKPILRPEESYWVCVCVCVCVCPWMWSDTTITLYTCND